MVYDIIQLYMIYIYIQYINICVCSTCSFRCLGVFLKMSVYHHLKKKIRKKRRSFVRFTGGNQGGFILQIRHLKTLRIIPDLIVTGFDDYNNDG